MRTLILLTALLSSFAQAGAWVGYGVSRHHYAVEVGANERHVAIGYSFSDGVDIGVYKNSFERYSPYISKTVLPVERYGLKAGYQVALAGNYPRKDIETDDAVHAQSDTYGFIPHAGFVVRREAKYITVDLGISAVSTLIFKYNLEN